jgi:TolB-like protein
MLGGTGMESNDVRSIAEQIARGVNAKLGTEGDRALIAVTPITNASRFRVDTELVRKKLTHDLVAHSEGATYLARDFEAGVAAERVDKRAGKYDHRELTRAMHGADYFLVGSMRGLSKTAYAGMSDYLLYSFELVDAETGGIVWAGDYETKKRASIDVVYR